MEKVFFQNSKGQKLCGILEEPDERKEEIVIMVHGYTTHKNRPTLVELAEVLGKRKINSLRIDLDGCGESEGDFAEQTISSAAVDIIAAVQFVESKGYSSVSLFGSSAGGLAVMTAALSLPNVQRIVLKAPVSDFVEQRRKMLGREGIEKWREQGFTEIHGKKVNYTFLEDAQKHIMYDQVTSIRCPVLIIHGDHDNSVPLEQSRKLVQGFPDARLVVLQNADHGLIIKGDRTLSTELFAEWFAGNELQLPQEAYYGH